MFYLPPILSLEQHPNCLMQFLVILARWLSLVQGVKGCLMLKYLDLSSRNSLHRPIPCGVPPYEGLLLIESILVWPRCFLVLLLAQLIPFECEVLWQNASHFELDL